MTNKTKFKPLAPPEDATIETLFNWAASRFGFDEDMVRKTMKANNVLSFRVDSWWTYTSLLRAEWWRMKQLENPDPEYPEDGCPICRGEVVRNVTKDNKWGCRYGWDCRANRFHFMEYRVALLRKAFQEREEILESKLEHTDMEGDAQGDGETPPVNTSDDTGDHAVRVEATAEA